MISPGDAGATWPVVRTTSVPAARCVSVNSVAAPTSARDDGGGEPQDEEEERPAALEVGEGVARLLRDVRAGVVQDDVVADAQRRRRDLGVGDGELERGVPRADAGARRRMRQTFDSLPGIALP